MILNYKKEAIVYQDIAYTYEELLQYSSCYSNHFSNGNIPKKVLVFSENSPEYFFCFYGAVRSNAIVVPVDVQSTPQELAYILSDCQPDIIFTTTNKIEVVRKAEEFLSTYNHVVITKNDIDISEVHSLPVTEIEDGNPDDTLMIIYTSGTTGSPKGVMLSYRNILFNVNSVSKQVPIFNANRNVMVLLPLHHAFPLIGSLIAPMYVGATVHIAEGLSAEAILSTLTRGKIAIIIGVPRLYDTLAKGIMTKINASFITKSIYKIVKTIGSDSLSKLVFSSIHKKFGGHITYLVSGGAALSIETATIFKALGFYILEGYGMSETAPMISFTRPGRRKIGYAGDPLPNIEVKIDDNGEVCVKGDNVMQGYYNRPDETAQIIQNGWLHTGDVGFLNQYGLKLTGRIKEIIVTPNGKNINPEIIEREILNSSTYIREIGVYMQNGTLCAVILPQLSTLRDKAIENMRQVLKDEIARFNSNVAPYKRIKQFFITSNELPKTRLGKIQRFKLNSLEKINQQSSNTNDSNPKSKIYLLLKSFIDSETGYNANENDHFEIDLAMDSLSRIALLTYIEHSFGIAIEEEQLDTLNTLSLLSQYIELQSNSISDTKISWKDILSAKIQDIKIPKSGITHWLMNHLFKIIFHLTYIYRGKGEQNIPDSPCIMVANHRSFLDGMIITSRLKQRVSKNTYFFAKEKHWRSSFTRFMAEKNNVILMDINKNLRQSLQQISAVLKGGKNVIIFPEGTRTQNNNLEKFRDTFAIISQVVNVPIIPVVISGSEKAVYKSIKLPRFLARIHVDFLEPIYPKNEQSAEKLRDRVVKCMRQKLKK